ncbi:phosphotransferase [Rickettsiales bacterium]|nr:phosphotransferase [Rickettsiales bacterium]
MTTREELILKFLADNNLEGFKREPMSSDASFRRYERLVAGDKSFILMDAPPEKEDVLPFINIDGYLRRRDLNAPEIYAKDENNGFLLLEDFGDFSFTNVLSGKTEYGDKYSEAELYIAATNVITQLHRSTLPNVMPKYDDELLLNECELLTKWYCPNILGGKIDDSAKDEYLSIWKDLCKKAHIGDDVVVLRDYHADNLMWLPERLGAKNVGILDFQDAVIGSPVYDIVSLLEDARRDVDSETVYAVIDHYLSLRKSIKKDDFMAAYAILAAQRNCKIIGIFARLAVRDGKERYLDYLPRVWGHLERGIEHPVLLPFKDWLNKYIPKELRNKKKFKLPEKEYDIA